MTLSTATWLNREHGYSARGLPDSANLCEPPVSLYYAAGYLQYLSHYAGRSQDLSFMVRAYRSGAKEVLARSASALYDSVHGCMGLGGEVLCDSSSAAALHQESRFWLSYIKALRHFAQMRASDANTESLFQPMHVVRPGESVASIAHACGSSCAAVYAVNPELKDGLSVAPGDCIALPCSCQPRLHYTVPGDSMASVAQQYDVPVRRLLRRNADVAPRYSAAISSGNLLEIPGLSSESASGSDGSAEEAELPWASLHSLVHPSQSRTLITCYRGGRISETGFRGISGIRSSEGNSPTPEIFAESPGPPPPHASNPRCFGRLHLEPSPPPHERHMQQRFATPLSSG